MNALRKAPKAIDPNKLKGEAQKQFDNEILFISIIALNPVKYRVENNPLKMVQVEVFVSVNTHATIGESLGCTRNTTQDPVIPDIVRQCSKDSIPITAVIVECPIDDGDRTR